MEPEELSRVIGHILGSAPFTMDERDMIIEAMGQADSIEDMPDNVKQLLSRVTSILKTSGGGESPKMDAPKPTRSGTS